MDEIRINFHENFKFNIDFHVQTNDVNAGGHVGNDIFVRYINETCYRLLKYHNVEPRTVIMADLAIMFRSEAFHEDVLKIEAAVSDLRNHSCHFYYRVSSKQTGKEILRARARMVFYDYTLKEKTEVPDEIKLAVTV